MSIADLYNKLFYLRHHPQKGIHACKIFKKGDDKIRRKLIEEASELASALQSQKSEEILGEASDTLYYLLLLLVQSDLDLDSVCDRIMEKRFAPAVSVQ